MFAFPEAKRVRREDLLGNDDSESSDGEMDAELQARLNAQIAKSLGLDQESEDTHTAGRSQAPVLPDAGAVGQAEEPEELEKPGEPEELEKPEEDGYAFRLFSTAGPTPKIVLKEPEGTGEGGLLRPRPLSDYISGAPSAELRSQYALAAVTGDEVISRSRTRSWGMELPWKVTTIKVFRKATGEVVRGAGGGNDADAGKRKRPGKKRRVAMRTRERAREKAKEATKQKEMDKEEHMKEKRKRMNRLKKLRKRAKKKGGEAGGGGGGGDDQDDDDDSGSE